MRLYPANWRSALHGARTGTIFEVALMLSIMGGLLAGRLRDIFYGHAQVCVRGRDGVHPAHRESQPD